jgi:hypothetical protein
VTSTKVGALGVHAVPANETKSTGPSCGWTDSAIAFSFGVTLLASNTNGIGAAYAKKGQAAYFEPLTIQGYPAAFFSPFRKDDRPVGDCGIVVGIADNLEVDILVQAVRDPQKSQACQLAKQVADAMITTLKGDS